MTKLAIKLTLLPLMLLGLPMLGVYLGGLPLERYLEFPPRSVYIQPAPFHAGVSATFALFFLAWILPFLFRFLKTPRRETSDKLHPFPLWGWAAGAATGIFWWLAWTRQPWMESIQIHTFTPLWLGFILVVNGLEVRRRGDCILTREWKRFLLLFPLSAAFWWFFEYLNRFVQNWHYSGTNLEAAEYFIAATLPFSTVLPAVVSVREYLLSFDRMNTAFKNFNPITCPAPRAVSLAVLLLTAASLLLLGIYPDALFGALWISPLLILVSLQRLLREETIFTPLRTGDWRIVLTSALAALICGFFWELWNWESLARWAYAVPYVQAFHLFEMPAIGYGGYLPFGLECTVIADLILRGSERRPGARDR